MTYAVPMKDSVTVILDPAHKAVLDGLRMRNPDKTLSDLLYIALEPFCAENREAAGETEVLFETSLPEQEPAIGLRASL